MKNILAPFILLAGMLLFMACKQTQDEPTVPPGKAYSNDVVLEWNENAYAVMGGVEIVHSLLCARVYAMVHLAMHDALNAVEPRFQTYAYHTRSGQSADPVAAIATAAYEVLLAAQPGGKPMLDSLLAVSMARVPAGEAKTTGAAVGKQAAAAIIALRQTDGALADPVFPLEPTAGLPGVYQAVPPFNFVFAPHWTTLMPFSLEKPEQFRISPHPAVESEAYAVAFDEVKRIGQKGSPERSAEQSEIAKFWYEYSEEGWNRLARVVAADKKLDLHATARLFALVNMAMSDAYVAGWDSKFHYNFWRPYTAIRAAKTDGNDLTKGDPNWEPAEVTPPVQDYPSTHSALGQAAATVLTSVLGNDVAFSFSSPTAAPGAPAQRSFTSFNQAALENAESRVLAGIHFRFSCEKGLELGEKIGKWTVEKHLQKMP